MLFGDDGIGIVAVEPESDVVKNIFLSGYPSVQQVDLGIDLRVAFAGRYIGNNAADTQGRDAGDGGRYPDDLFVFFPKGYDLGRALLIDLS